MPFALLAVAAVVASCTALAGLDGDYVVGDVASSGGGQHAGASSGAGPSAGGATSAGGVGVQGGGGASSGTMMVGSGGSAGSGGSPPTSQRQVSCNGTPCAVGEVCCATANASSFDNTQVGCAPAGGCGASEFEIKCDGAEDCDAAQVCCGRWPNGYYVDVECTTANDCQIGNSDYIFCIQGGVPNGGLCVNGGSCLPSSDLPNYSYCG